MSDSVLAACPFCGSDDVFVEQAGYSSSYVFCNKCAAHGPHCNAHAEDDGDSGKAAAVREWNCRHVDTYQADVSEPCIIGPCECGGYGVILSDEWAARLSACHLDEFVQEPR